MEDLDPYALVAAEMKAGIRHDALVARSWAESGGDRDRAQAIYIRIRAQEFATAIQAAQLKTEREAQAAKEEAKRRANEARISRQRRFGEAANKRQQFWDEFGPYLWGIVGVAFVLWICWVLSSPTVPSGLQGSTATSLSPATETPLSVQAETTPSTEASAAVTTKPPLRNISEKFVTDFVQSFLDARQLSTSDFEAIYYASKVEVGGLSKGSHTIYTQQRMAAFAASHRTPGVAKIYTLLKPVRYYRLGDDNRWEVDYNLNEVLFSKSDRFENDCLITSLLNHHRIRQSVRKSHLSSQLSRKLMRLRADVICRKNPFPAGNSRRWR